MADATTLRRTARPRAGRRTEGRNRPRTTAADTVPGAPRTARTRGLPCRTYFFMFRYTAACTTVNRAPEARPSQPMQRRHAATAEVRMRKETLESFVLGDVLRARAETHRTEVFLKLHEGEIT